MTYEVLKNSIKHFYGTSHFTNTDNKTVICWSCIYSDVVWLLNKMCSFARRELFCSFRAYTVYEMYFKTVFSYHIYFFYLRSFFVKCYLHSGIFYFLKYDENNCKRIYNKHFLCIYKIRVCTFCVIFYVLRNIHPDAVLDGWYIWKSWLESCKLWNTWSYIVIPTDSSVYQILCQSESVLCFSSFITMFHLLQKILCQVYNIIYNIA